MEKLNIRIPKQHVLGFKYLIDMPADRAKTLIDTLGEMDKPRAIEALSKEVSEKIELDEEKVQSILEMLLSILGFAKNATLIPKEDIVNGIVEASKRELGEKSKSKWNLLTDLLNKFLEFEPNVLGLLSKVIEEMGKREKLMLETEIITDIRPIATEEGISENSIILHTLKIDYLRNGNEQTSYIAVDVRDLNTLKKQIESTLNRVERIKSNLKDGCFSPIDYPG